MTELPPPDARLPEGYYLANILTVLEDVESRYGDLLLSQETAVIQGFRRCSLGAQRLYVRMLTRKGPWFRTDRLEYKEIGDPRPFVDELIREGFCDDQATLPGLLPLLIRADILRIMARLGLEAPKGLRREELLLRLQGVIPEDRLLELLHQDLRPVKPLLDEFWRRILLLFFGNFEQDLSSFVVADIGRIQFETYAVDPKLRLFETRKDVDYLLSLRGLREQLNEVTTTSDLVALTDSALSMEAHPGIRQQRRFQGLLNALGQAWERAKDLDKAWQCYAMSDRPPARERRTRILSAQGSIEPACALAIKLYEAPRDVGEARFARRFLERHRKRSPAAEAWLLTHSKPEAAPEIHLALPRHPSGSVERTALEAANQDGWEGFFAENRLWCAIFGLVFWDELFAAIPGAFHHRFQNAPLDLGSTEFYSKRKAQIDDRLAAITGTSNLEDHLLGIADLKWGITNRFVSWRHLDRFHLAEALKRIEPRLLSRLLRIMVQSPLAFDSGFPDLFLYRREDQAWKLWEVKGPGDTLRPEQEWWLHQFNQLGAPALVARLRFTSSPED